MEVFMPTHTKPRNENSPLAIFTELAVEGTSSLVEVQRALLHLAQQESNIILNGVKERIGAFVPAAAATDFVRRSVDTVIEAQQELLTATSKQTLQWLEGEKAGKDERTAHVLEFAREGVETFARAQKKFLDVAAQEAAKAIKGKPEHVEPAKKTELAQLAREAGNAFIEAQKRLLDVFGQQMNVNLNATTKALELVSPSRLMPIANFTGEGVRNFVGAETDLFSSLIAPHKKAVKAPKPAKARTVRKPKAVVV